MRAILISLVTFFIPFVLFGDHVGNHVANHLANASFCYSAKDIELGYFAFYLFAGTMAGVVSLAVLKILSFRKPQKYLSLVAVLLPLAWGYVIADTTLYGFYERIQFTGPVMQWLADTAQAFCFWGLMPAAGIFIVILFSSRQNTIDQTS